MSSSNEEDAQEAAAANRRPRLPKLGGELDVEAKLVSVIRNLLAHAVYDEERTDKCIAAVSDAKRAVKKYGARHG